MSEGKKERNKKPRDGRLPSFWVAFPFPYLKEAFSRPFLSIVHKLKLPGNSLMRYLSFCTCLVEVEDRVYLFFFDTEATRGDFHASLSALLLLARGFIPIL